MDYQENRFSTSRMADFLLLGGGLASATAAETLRLEGAEGSVVIVSAESRLPYHRPPLSGRLLKGEAPHEPPRVLNEEDYRARRIEVLRGVRALGVDPERHLVHTDGRHTCLSQAADRHRRHAGAATAAGFGLAAGRRALESLENARHESTLAQCRTCRPAASQPADTRRRYE